MRVLGQGGKKWPTSAVKLGGVVVSFCAAETQTSGQKSGMSKLRKVEINCEEHLQVVDFVMVFML